MEKINFSVVRPNDPVLIPSTKIGEGLQQAIRDFLIFYGSEERIYLKGELLRGKFIIHEMYIYDNAKDKYIKLPATEVLENWYQTRFNGQVSKYIDILD